MSRWYVIFGAAVRTDGAPSGTLARRIEGALAAAAGDDDARFMPTGGLGATGYVEAEVMRRMLLAAGIAPDRIVAEGAARDTLESVRLCDDLLRRAGEVAQVVVCTSRYHQPRCALLLRMLGWRVAVPPMPGDQGRVAVWKLLAFHLKEVVALPYDAALLMLARRG
jgi:uncharacterized SAM-binding protein YcdF (DUF218 family)